MAGTSAADQGAAVPSGVNDGASGETSVGSSSSEELSTGATPSDGEGASGATPEVETEPSGAEASDSSASDSSQGPVAEQDPSVADPSGGVNTDDVSGDSAPAADGTPPASANDGSEVEQPAPETAEMPLDDGDCAIAPPSESPIGYGAATTGGGDATPVEVSSFTEAEAALADYRSAFKEGTQDALVIRYTGTFDYSTITDVCLQHTLDSQVLQIKEMENVTFEGAPGSSANFGIKVNRAKNVIIRNMTMGLLPGGGDSDAITLEGNGTSGDVENVWIDHNELFSSTKDDCDGAGDTEFDGLIDIKSGARYITISYNYIHDHQKTGLIGYSDSDTTDRYVTFHHNWYENVVSRTPLHRYGYVHLFNNYYDHILSSGINVRMNGVALIESNFFENAQNPVTSRYSDEAGSWELRDNYVGQGITWTVSSDTLANADSWQSTTTFPESELTYSYAAEEARCVKKTVTSLAGPNLSL